jgi:branched-chain amino acid transport system permease protein
MIGPYLIHITIIIVIYLILALSLNLTVGYVGLLNMAHIAFFAIGAYTSTLLTQFGVPWIFVFLGAGILASATGYVLILATNKLKGDYLALATLGFGFVVSSLLLNWKSLTNGTLGISGITRPTLFGLKISNNYSYLILVLILAIIIWVLLKKITKSNFGKLLQGVRDNELLLKTLGKDSFSLKSKAMMISAFFAGIAGSLYAHYISFIDPGSFAMADIILLFTIVIVGGLASFRGTLLATILLVSIPEVLRFFTIPSSILGPTRQIIYAIILLFILLWKPRGMFGRFDLK